MGGLRESETAGHACAGVQNSYRCPEYSISSEVPRPGYLPTKHPVSDSSLSDNGGSRDGRIRHVWDKAEVGRGNSVEIFPLVIQAAGTSPNQPANQTNQQWPASPWPAWQDGWAFWAGWRAACLGFGGSLYWVILVHMW